MDGDGRMTDGPAPDITRLLQSLMQQQTALLELHGEAVRLQRLLIERFLDAPSGAAPSSGLAEPPDQAASTPTARIGGALMDSPVADASSEPCAIELVTATPSQVSASAAEPRHTAPAQLVADSASRSARYYQVRQTPAPKPVQPQDLELMRQLHSIGEANSLILNFGPHKGSVLAQVAISDPDYIRQLMTRAQRPEVRAAASRLVSALDAAAAHKPRPTRVAGRRSRPTT